MVFIFDEGVAGTLMGDETVIIEWEDSVEDRKRPFEKMLKSYRRGGVIVAVICAVPWVGLFLVFRFHMPMPEMADEFNRVFLIGLCVIIGVPLSIPLLCLVYMHEATLFKITDMKVIRLGGSRRRICKWDEVEGYCVRVAQEVDGADLLVFNLIKARPPFTLTLPRNELRDQIIQEVSQRVPLAEAEKQYDPPLSKDDMVRMGVFTLVSSLCLAVLLGSVNWKPSDIIALPELAQLLMLLLGPATLWQRLFEKQAMADALCGLFAHQLRTETGATLRPVPPITTTTPTPHQLHQCQMNINTIGQAMLSQKATSLQTKQ